MFYFDFILRGFSDSSQDEHTPTMFKIFLILGCQAETVHQFSEGM
jgi:hypothetical protein